MYLDPPRKTYTEAGDTLENRRHTQLTLSPGADPPFVVEDTPVEPLVDGTYGAPPPTHR